MCLWLLCGWMMFLRPALAEDAGDAAVRARALLAQMQPVRDHNVRADSRRMADQILSYAEQSGNPQLLAEALEAQTWVAIGEVDFAGARAAMARWEQLGPEQQLPGWRARRLYAQAVNERREGRSSEAMVTMESALQQCRLAGDRECEIDAINALARLRRRGGALYQSLTDHTRALAIAREIGDARRTAQSTALIARVYSELDDHEQAVHFYDQALQIWPDGTGGERTDLLTDAAGAFLARGQLDRAQALSDEAVRVAEADGGAQIIATAYGRRARVLLALGHPQEALDWAERSIAKGEGVDGLRSQIVRQNVRLTILEALGRSEEAADAAATLLQQARSSGDRLLERDILELQARLLYADGRWEQAYMALKAYVELDKTIAPSLASRRIADLESSLKRAQIEAEVDRVARERDLERLKAQRRAVLGWGLGLVLALLSVLGLALIGRYRAVHQLNRVLQEGAEQLRQAAMTDALTGVPNRTALAPILAADQQSPSTRGRGAILIDIDHFKQINDRHGHLIGDAVLRQVAARLAEVVHQRAPGVHLARWGGEEFVVLGEFDGIEAASTLASALREVVAGTPCDTEKGLVAVTVSCGLRFESVGAAARWEDLLRTADDALYAAKAAGRNEVWIS